MEILKLRDIEGRVHELTDKYIISELEKAYNKKPKSEKRKALRKLELSLNNIFYTTFKL